MFAGENPITAITAKNNNPKNNFLDINPLLSIQVSALLAWKSASLIEKETPA
jgi:hypothetical protein